jgi:hypothetical protein
MTPAEARMAAGRAASAAEPPPKLPRPTAAQVAQAVAVALDFLSAPSAGTLRFFLKFSMTKLDDYCGESWDERDFRYDDERARAVIDLAITGNTTANALLLEVAGMLPNPPPNLAKYIQWALVNRYKRGRPGRPRNSDRDLLVYFAVEKIRGLGFSGVRSPESDDASACSIVASASAEWMSEKNVERIWREVRLGKQKRQRRNR